MLHGLVITLIFSTPPLNLFFPVKYNSHLESLGLTQRSISFITYLPSGNLKQAGNLKEKDQRSSGDGTRLYSGPKQSLAWR